MFPLLVLKFMKQATLILFSIYFLVVNTGYHACFCPAPQPAAAQHASCHKHQPERKHCCSQTLPGSHKGCRGVVLKVRDNSQLQQVQELAIKPAPKQAAPLPPVALALFQPDPHHESAAPDQAFHDPPPLRPVGLYLFNRSLLL